MPSSIIRGNFSMRLFYYKIKALSLVEMTVVLTIIAIVTSAIVIYFAGPGSRRLEGEARKIVSDLCWARDMAVGKHINYIITFDTTDDSYAVYEDRNRDDIPDAGEKLNEVRLETDLIPPTPASISFHFPYGRIQAASISLNYRGNSREIRIFPATGYVRME